MKLKEIVTFGTGKLNSNAARENGKYPFFTCSQQTFKTNTYSFDCEAVLLGGNNANGIYPLKYFKGKFDAYQRTYVICTKDEDILLNKYLYYALSLKLALLQSHSSGVTTKFLTLDILNNIDIDLPTRLVQEKIASILSTYDDLIENNTRRITILEEMAQLIYKEWFVNFRFPGHEKVKFVNSELGKIPERWKVISLGDICYIEKNKYKEPEHSTLPLLDLARIPRRSLVINSLGSSGELKTSRIIFRKGSVLFGSIRPYFHKVFYAFCDGVTNTSVFVIKAAEPATVSFLLSLLFSEDSVNWANQNSGGTKMPVISWDVFKTMKVILPDKNLLSKYDTIVTSFLQETCVLNLKNLKLKVTRDLLLPKLISGKLNVSYLDIDTRKQENDT